MNITKLIEYFILGELWLRGGNKNDFKFEEPAVSCFKKENKNLIDEIKKEAQKRFEYKVTYKEINIAVSAFLDFNSGRRKIRR
jgi:hypothetical protein